MQIVSDAYKSFMSQPVRPPFHMRITVHTDTPIIYTDDEIFEFEEKKTAHPIGAELPSIEVSFKVDNIAGDYNPESPSGLYEQLIKGVKVTYEYGLEIPQLKPYGYTGEVGETPEPTYGMDAVNPYGFLGEGIIEWIDGGEVYTTGEISYDKTSATIEAVDALSFLEETADVAYGTINRKQCAQFIIEATDYPIDTLGAKKIVVDNLLETWNTNLVSDNNAKQVLQSLAHASGVQIYIDRGGYLHLDKLPITTGTIDYHVTLGEQDEDGDFTKGKTPRKVTVKVNTTNVVPEVSETINPKGEDILVENGFVQTSQQAQVVLPWVKRYLGMRNIAEINYAGEPALDILDIVLLDTEYGTDIPATVVETMIHFDGAITGSLVLRYDSTLADTSTVKITGAENFTYDGNTPSPASVTLVCETDMTTPSYEWSYFNDSSSGWQTISGATTANLTIIADSAYFDGNKPTSFRVTVTGAEGTKGTSVRIQRVQEPVEQGHKYLGKLGAYPSAYDSGDYFLVSSPFGSYILGDVVQWTGTAWAVTTHTSIIPTVYQDALTLSLPLDNASAVNQYIRSLQSKQILLSTDVPVMFFYSDNTPYDGGQISTITASRLNLATGINWYINGDLVADVHEDTINVYDTDMSGDKITVTAVSTEYTNVSAVIVIAKQRDRALEASNLGLITDGDPTPKVGKEGAPLVAGDYFMWGNPTTSTPDVRKKGAVYIRQVDGSWLEDSDGTKTMSMFAQFAGLPNDTDSSVMGNAVIKKLVALDAFIETLQSQLIEITTGGAIYSGYSSDGLTPPTSGSGFWLGASGKLKAYFAELLGTLRTGLNAPTDARVAIQDQTGITSGPTFTGSGLNDLTITNDGDVAGNFRVKISGINNTTNSGEPEYWVTPFKVGTYLWQGIAVNSSGRFVAVGIAGYVSYSNDGITWATPFAVGNQMWRSVEVNSSGRFVAVGDAGYVSYSDDGITWVTPFFVGTKSWYGIAVNSSGKFVAGGADSYFTYSNDGITWATPFTVGNTTWRTIAVNSSGRFVAVGYYGYFTYSNDGITWATPFTVGTYFWHAIAVNSSGRFVAGGRDGYVSYSNDGITWATPFTVGTYYWQRIAVNSSGRFVAVGDAGYVSYSDDGITWVTPFKVGTKTWYGIAVNSSGRFGAVGAEGYITMSLLQETIQISSNGGTTWGSDTIIPLDGAISITGFGIDILFGHTEGHTVGDYWSFEQGAMRGLVITDLDGDEYFSASGGVVNVKETLLLSGIPTSATGLPSGSVWRDGTTLKIV